MVGLVRVWVGLFGPVVIKALVAMASVSGDLNRTAKTTNIMCRPVSFLALAWERFPLALAWERFPLELAWDRFPLTKIEKRTAPLTGASSGGEAAVP